MATATTNDFKNGMTFVYDGILYSVVEFQHVKPGKGSAFVRAKIKNLRNGSVIENTFNAGLKIELAHIDKRQMQFLYEMGGTYYFMDTNTFEQSEISKSALGDDAKFLKENLVVTLMSYEGELLGMMLPDKIDYLITSSEPAVKGNTSSSAMKDAVLETGMTVKVPLFINEGETVIVSTKDGKYVSRA